VPHLRHVGVVCQDGCHPGIGLRPLLRAALTAPVLVYSSVPQRLPSIASGLPRALALFMLFPHQHPRLPVLGSLAEGT
jgi:hypothetical protein